MLYDKSVPEAVRLQSPVFNSFPKSEVSKNIYKIVMKFIDQPADTFYKNNFQKFISNFFIRRN